MGYQGPHKLADRWQEPVYVVKNQPDISVHVFEVRREDGQVRVQTLHRNMLLPICAIGDVPQSSAEDSEHQPQLQLDSQASENEEQSSSEESTPLVLPCRPPIPAPHRRTSVPQSIPFNTTRVEPRLLLSSLSGTSEDEILGPLEAVDNDRSGSQQEQVVVIDEDSPEDSSSASEQHDSPPRRSTRVRLRPAQYDPEVYLLEQRARHHRHKDKVKKKTLFL